MLTETASGHVGPGSKLRFALLALGARDTLGGRQQPHHLNRDEQGE
jgi:hypothetical protein